MTKLILRTYHFFNTHRSLLWLKLVVLFGVFVILASRIQIKEDVSDLLPDSEQTKDINRILKNASFADKVIIKVKSDNDQTEELLFETADSLAEDLGIKFSDEVESVKYRVEDDVMLGVYNTIQQNLPLFIDAEDYITFDSLTTHVRIKEKIANNYSTLFSASGFMQKKLITDDPLGLSLVALKKLQTLQVDDNYIIQDGYILSKDEKSIYLFVALKNTSSETAKNVKLFEQFDQLFARVKSAHNGLQIYYYGNPVVAAGNARQLKADSMLTMSLTVVAIVLFIGFFFKSKRAPFVMLLPVAFGGLFSIGVIALFKGSISSIALGAGSVVLGIAINYSLHFFAHHKHTSSTEQAIRDLITPLTIGSFTTVSSFFALCFLQSRILNDFGLFAGLSLTGAILFTLFLLPHFLGPANDATKHEEEVNAKDSSIGWKWQLGAFIFIAGLSVFFWQYAGEVQFEEDLNSMNFLDKTTLESQKEIDITQSDTSKLIFIAAKGRTLEEALISNELLAERLNTALKRGEIEKYSLLADFYPSKVKQKTRIDRWNAYWTQEKKARTLADAKQAGKENHFSEAAFTRFESMLYKDYHPVDLDELNPIREAVGQEYFLEDSGQVAIVNPVKVSKEERMKFYSSLASIPGIIVLDKQVILSKLINSIVADFNAILYITASIVFIALLLSYGRLELAIFTFLPMFISWVWILGIMGLIGLKFNLINIIISTFIFGLGDDFSIFTTDGLLEKYKSGKGIIRSHRTSIILCAITVLIGLGMLVFAKHPALKSIAVISVVGILCVVIVGQIIQPAIFNFFIQSRKEKGLAPWTIPTMALALFAFSYYVIGSFLLTVTGYILFYLMPFVSMDKRKRFFHFLICNCLKSLSYIMINVRKVHINKETMDFSKPAIIISNHISFLDILVTVMQHPRLILLTNHWVYYSPVFGKVVQMADYYPVMEGVDPALDKFSEIIKKGYSIVIFPEGTRSADGEMKRFHKGAFYLAEKLNLDIVPLVLHGTGDTMKKGDFMLFNGQKTMKYLPRISADDTTFGDNYASKTKNISRYFKEQYQLLSEQIETARYFAQKLRMNYIYKGSELEIRAWNESHNSDFYQSIHDSLPKFGNITVLGCDVGFCAYMVSFLSRNRNVTGFDSHQENIDIANNCYSKNSKVNFRHETHLSSASLTSDAFIIDLRYCKEDADDLINNAKEHMEKNGVIILVCDDIDKVNCETSKVNDKVYVVK